MTARRAYDAIVLDLDGTLLDEGSSIRPRNREALLAAEAAGVKVMIATGRSSLSADPVLVELDLGLPAIVFNGAGLYCARKKRLLEERILSNRSVERVLAYARERDLLTVVMRADDKLTTRPHDEEEERALRWMTGLKRVERDALEGTEYVIRVTLLSRDHGDSARFAREVEEAVRAPCYITDFPLHVLPHHRDSALDVIDLHPPCLGKAEALRFLREEHGVDPARVVAVGDATNDLPMFEAAGLSVCMAEGMPEARAAARRVIGSNESDAIADLVEELFLAPARA